MRRRLSILVLVLTIAPQWQALAASTTLEHRRLHIEQQHDALNLQLRHSAAARRHALSPSDARRLDHLALRQRMQQQQLELEQSQRQRALDRNAGARLPGVQERQLEAQRAAFAQERALQLQRFELDRQRELQTMPREPLQAPLGSRAIDLR